MGSCDYDNYQPVTDHIRTAEQAYKALVDEAGWSSGYEYSGTISNSGGWVWITQTPVGMAKANQLANTYLDRYGKWDPAGCIPITEVKTATRTVTRTVRPPHLSSLNFTEGQHAELYDPAGLWAGIELKPGERIAKIETISDEVGDPKVKVIRNRGKAERKFTAYEGGREVASGPTLDDVTARVSDWLVKRASNASGFGSAPGDIKITETVLRGGEAAATITTSVDRKVKVKVTIARDVSSGGKVVGWRFVGWAPS